MTVERNVVVSIEDIRALIFECKTKDCARLTLLLSAITKFPDKCPTCGVSWLTEPRTVSGERVPTGIKSFIEALDIIRKNPPANVQVLFEFAEPLDK